MYLNAIGILLSLIVIESLAHQIYEIGARREGDQYILSECRITNRSEQAEWHGVNFKNEQILMSYAKLDIFPTWTDLGYLNPDFYMDIDVGNYETDQIHVVLEVYGFLQDPWKSRIISKDEIESSRVTIRNNKADN